MPVKSRFAQLGAEAPDFTLPTPAGEKITLSDYRGDKNVVLVFLRGFL
jgi:peroxiredoxin